MSFLSALCSMAKEAKRVLAKETDVESEKYAFWCFLLRLGFIGNDSKVARKILLRNLSGYSAFRNKAEEEKFKANQKTKRDAAKTERLATVAAAAVIEDAAGEHEEVVLDDLNHPGADSGDPQYRPDEHRCVAFLLILLDVIEELGDLLGLS